MESGGRWMKEDEKGERRRMKENEAEIEVEE